MVALLRSCCSYAQCAPAALWALQSGCAAGIDRARGRGPARIGVAPRAFVEGVHSRDRGSIRSRRLGTIAGEVAAICIASRKRNVYLDGSDLLDVSVFGPTVGQSVEGWLARARVSVRESTWAAYRIAVGHLVDGLGGGSLRLLSALEVERFEQELLASGRSAKTVANVHAVLHRALADAARDGLVDRNVASLVSPPRAERPEMSTWTVGELKQFLRWAEGHRLYGAFVVLATTGMRRGEVLGLQRADVDLARAEVSVRRTVGVVDGRIEGAHPSGISCLGSVVLQVDAHRSRGNGSLYETGGASLHTSRLPRPVRHRHRRGARSALRGDLHRRGVPAAPPRRWRTRARLRPSEWLGWLVRLGGDRLCRGCLLVARRGARTRLARVTTAGHGPVPDDDPHVRVAAPRRTADTAPTADRPIRVGRARAAGCDRSRCLRRPGSGRTQEEPGVRATISGCAGSQTLLDDPVDRRLHDARVLGRIEFGHFEVGRVVDAHGADRDDQGDRLARVRQ